jgi:hypothetical protein
MPGTAQPSAPTITRQQIEDFLSPKPTAVTPGERTLNASHTEIRTRPDHAASVSVRKHLIENQGNVIPLVFPGSEHGQRASACIPAYPFPYLR